MSDYTYNGIRYTMSTATITSSTQPQGFTTYNTRIDRDGNVTYYVDYTQYEQYGRIYQQSIEEFWAKIMAADILKKKMNKNITIL